LIITESDEKFIALNNVAKERDFEVSVVSLISGAIAE
jgi:hypothetical protein